MSRNVPRPDADEGCLLWPLMGGPDAGVAIVVVVDVSEGLVIGGRRLIQFMHAHLCELCKSDFINIETRRWSSNFHNRNHIQNPGQAVNFSTIECNADTLQECVYMSEDFRTGHDRNSKAIHVTPLPEKQLCASSSKPKGQRLWLLSWLN